MYKSIVHRSTFQGRRKRNEDNDLVYLNLTNKNNTNSSSLIDLFIICDGHGGNEISRITVPLLKKYITREKTFPLNGNTIVNIYDKIENRIETLKESEYCGCTAIVGIIYKESNSVGNTRKHKKERNNNDNTTSSSNGDEYYVQIINLGDCRALLAKNGFAIPMSKDHKPDWPDELRRITNLNNELRKKKKQVEQETIKDVVLDDGEWRVGGQSVSRSFGDVQNKPQVSHIPENNICRINNCDFLVICCDGITDVLQNHNIVNFIYSILRTNGTEEEIKNSIDPYFNNLDIVRTESKKYISQNIAEMLIMYAQKMGTDDNTSVIIVFFDMNN